MAFSHSKTRALMGLLLLLNLSVFSQSLKSFRGAYQLNNGVKGTANYTYFSAANDSVVYNGKFSFNSDAFETDSAKKLISQLNISGNFQKGQKNGEWIYEKNNYTLNVKSINDLRVTATLDGLQQKLNAQYEQGKPTGKWILTSNQIEDSKRKGTSYKSEATFKDGYANGTFSYASQNGTSPISITGRFDSQGNFDGKWLLKYESDGVLITEERKYVEGFLTEMNIYSEQNRKIYYSKVFNDVVQKLQTTTNNGNELSYKKGEKQFPILFSDGYRQDDEKILFQLKGNFLLSEIFTQFTDAEQGIVCEVGNFEMPNMGYTRRFQYVYPEYEAAIIAELNKYLEAEKSRHDSLLNNTTFKIYKQKNDTLAFFYEFLNVSSQKLQIIETNLNKITSGAFDYEYRDNFYQSGIPGLNPYDTIKYEFGSNIISKPVTFSSGVVAPNDLVKKIKHYCDSLKLFLDTGLIPVKAALAEFQKEEKIALLDEKIAEAIDSMQMRYRGTLKYSVTENNNDSTAEKTMSEMQEVVYTRFGIEIKNQKMQQYANEPVFDKKVEIGYRIIALMNLMINIHDKLNAIPQMSYKLDKAFTEYRPNPYFPRDVESRIKSGIYSRGAEILLPHLINNIKNLNSTAELKERIELIFTLEQKLLTLAKSNDPDVSRLNKRLRRENQPERIKRLLLSQQF